MSDAAGSAVVLNPQRISVFSLSSGAALVDRICRQLGVEPSRHEEREFEDGEHKIRPLEGVRGHDVYIVESLYGDAKLTPNDKLVRVLMLLAALRDAGAQRLTCIAPYLCYARKDRRTKPRDPVSSRYVASLFEAVGIDRFVTVDVHNPAAYENAFRVPAEHLTMAPGFVTAIANRLGEESAVVVSPDAGGVKRAELLRQSLESELGRPVGFGFVEKFRSEGVVRGSMMAGEVRDRAVILVDDLISGGTTLARAASACRERGARTIWAVATHGLFSADASSVLSRSSIDCLVIADTIWPARLDAQLLQTRVQVIDCAPLLAAALHRLHTHGSLAELSVL